MKRTHVYLSKEQRVNYLKDWRPTDLLKIFDLRLTYRRRLWLRPEAKNFLKCLRHRFPYSDKYTDIDLYCSWAAIYHRALKNNWIPRAKIALVDMTTASSPTIDNYLKRAGL
jgi:hypothetical protein